MKFITKKTLIKPRRNTKQFDRSHFKAPFVTNEWDVDRHQVLTIEDNHVTNRHIIFLHGGAYVCEATLFHRMTAKKLVKMGLRVTFFDYPLSPESTPEAIHASAISMYESLVKKYPNDRFSFFGDSAGGGLALSLLMQLRDKGIEAPKKNVLISPWLDVGISNQDVAKYTERDKILPLDVVTQIGKTFAGAFGINHPYVSPIFGNFENLGDLFICYGSEELTYPDCKMLVLKAESAKGTTIQEIIGEGEGHDYILFPFSKKAKEAYRKIGKFLQ